MIEFKTGNILEEDVEALVNTVNCGLESPFGLELLSTVHWISTNEGAQALDDIVKMTYAWMKGRSSSPGDKSLSRPTF